MARFGFFEENENRAYPFVAGGAATMMLGGTPVELPVDAIVDFGCIVGLDARFFAIDTIYLTSIARAGDVFTFTFASTAPGLVDMLLSFTRSLADPEFTTETAEVLTPYPDYPGEDIGDCPLDTTWEGYLVTGDLTTLAVLLPDGATLLAGTDRLTVEPCLIQNLAHAYVRTINLANQDRTHAYPPDHCAGAVLTTPPDPYRTIVSRRCITGPILLEEGFNAALRQNPRERSIVIGAALGAGRGHACAEIPLFSGELPPDGSSLLSGGPTCAELVSSINGLAGPMLHFEPGQGTRIAPAKGELHRLVIDFDLRTIDSCPKVGGTLGGSVP